MVRQILFGVYAEGPTDYRYYPTLLSRYVRHLCWEKSVAAEVMEPLPMKRSGGSFIEQMKKVEAEFEGLQYIFVHNDADGRTADNVVENKWQPWIERCEQPEKWIPVVPVKMLESWLLADREALETTFIIKPAAIAEILGNVNAEQIPDPKAKLNEIIRAGKQRKTTGYEENLAQRSSFSELEKLPSFQDLRSRLLEVMFERGS